MKKIGEKLKEAREKKNITLFQAAQETKIRRRYLWALEEGEHNDFPAEIYLLGFLRTYAEYLNLDSESIMNQYRVNKENEQKTIDKINYKEKQKIIIKKKKRTIYAVLGILILLFLFIGIKHISIPQKKSSINSEKKPVGSSHQPIRIINLEARTKDKCWIRVNIDGKESFEGLLYKGENKIWNAKRMITIRVGYVHGIEIFCNKKKVDILKDSEGDINEFNITLNEKGEIKIKQQKPLIISPLTKPTQQR